jgi:hypothetical protein
MLPVINKFSVNSVIVWVNFFIKIILQLFSNVLGSVALLLVSLLGLSLHVMSVSAQQTATSRRSNSAAEFHPATNCVASQHENVITATNLSGMT